MPETRDAEHGNTQVFARPSSGNFEWRRVRSLLDEVATVTEEPNGNLRVTHGGETEVLEPPRGKDVDTQMLVDLRRMLTHAGITPSAGTTPVQGR
jgi:hypothetical protein